jgi:hypothetical protein
MLHTVTTVHESFKVHLLKDFLQTNFQNVTGSGVSITQVRMIVMWVIIYYRKVRRKRVEVIARGLVFMPSFIKKRYVIQRY